MFRDPFFLKFLGFFIRTKGRVRSTVLSLVVIIFFIDWKTGFGIDVTVFYLAPIALSVWYVDRRSGILTSIVSFLVWMLADVMARDYQVSALLLVWNGFIQLTFFVIFSQMLGAIKKLLDGEKRLSRIDFKTGAYNLLSFYERAELEISRMRRYKRPLSVLYFDCDDFKTINDSSGHHAGDSVLCLVVDISRDCIRATDFMARMGGDEFSVLFPETDATQAYLIAERISRKFNTVMSEQGMSVTLSMGLATFITPPLSVDALIKRADDLMYQAKQDGKNRILTSCIDPDSGMC